ncbi:MAG TPA: translation initiation factor IF-2, partial [Chroococcales cyanobacterium]
MGKIRVYELAKQLNVVSKDLVQLLSGMGYEIKNHMSVLSDEMAEKALEKLTAPVSGLVPFVEESHEEAEILPEHHEEEVVFSELELQVLENEKPAPTLIKQPKKDESRPVVKPKAPDIRRPGKHHDRRDRRAPSEGATATVSKLVKLSGSVTVKELAEKMGLRETEIIKRLFIKGIMATINQTLEIETAEMIATEFGYAFELVDPTEEEIIAEEAEDEDDPRFLVVKAPVVTIMGHVDHGKTSLLDAIRKTSVTSGEAGGITQHIGAYQVVVNGQTITFLDTPGHEAFTAMRARGAAVTDIAILVVAADDGVKPQTEEAINHAKEAGVPIIVAINKIDKPGANPDEVKQQLTKFELVAEEWGGQTVMVPVSAKQKIGLDQLLEMILLVAEVQELKANPRKMARGIIVEAQLDKGMGPVATVLIQNGTLHIGDNFVVGSVAGKVRALINERGKRIREAGPAMPVEVLGMPTVPQAGDTFRVVEDEKTAKQIANQRVEFERSQRMQQSRKVSLDDLYARIQEGKIKDLKLIIKGDVKGSVEAIEQSLGNLNKEEGVAVKVIHGGTGDISEADVMLAAASDALVIGFNVKADERARRMAAAEQVDIRSYNIIYKLLEDIEAAMKGMLEPVYEEVFLGKAEVRQTFTVGKTSVIAGCYVIEGKMTRNCN